MNVAVIEVTIEEPGANVTAAPEEPERDVCADRVARPWMPLSVALVWLCAFAGLGAYAVGLCLPELGSP